MVLCILKSISNYHRLLTSFSFSSSISSLAAMQFLKPLCNLAGLKLLWDFTLLENYPYLVSRNALRCACSIRLWTKRPTTLTARNTRVFATS